MFGGGQESSYPSEFGSPSLPRFPTRENPLQSSSDEEEAGLAELADALRLDEE